jgi:Flp pilus assembly protein TadD
MRSVHGPTACYDAHAYCFDFGFREVRMKHWPVATVLIIVTAFIPALHAKAQQAPFTEEQVQGLVRNGAGDESGAKLIEQRGLNFVPTEDFLRSLKAEGANEAFLATLRSLKRPQPTSEEAKKPLNQVQIIVLLGGQVPSHRVAMLVLQRGTDFDVTDEYLREARLAGAEDELISALKTAKVAKPAAVDPTSTDRQVEARQHASRGAQLLYSKRFAEAESEYRAALRLDPQDGNLHSVLGLVLLDENNADGAIAEYREALRLEPNNDLAHSGLGASLAIKLDWDGAISEYREALRLNPYDGGTHSLLGTALASKGDREGAVTEYREAVRQKPYDDDAHFKLGVALGSKGDRDGAIAEYREAVRLNPNNGNAHLMLGSALGTKGDWDGEITEEREALRIEPANDAAHFCLGLALSVKGDTVGGMTEVRGEDE